MSEETKDQTLLQEFAGAFVESLTRNNKQIRNDRAVAIVEAAELRYRRTIEDIQAEIKRTLRERENAIDLSPTHADSLVLASDFDDEAFVKADIKIGIRVRELNIQLDIAKDRYLHLFGREFGK